MSDVIKITDLEKRFGTVHAVRGLTFTVPAGAVVGLLGGNGAGKTTTIGMMMGLVLPSAGRVEMLGADMARARHQVLARVNFESPYVEMPKRLTVRQNLRVFGGLYGIGNVHERIEEMSELFDLGAFIDRPSGQLSAGQKTRVALAKALINSPEVLLLDEPTASLDPDTADWVRTELERYRSAGRTILLASHNMPEVERLCDDVLMMREGLIVDRGSPAELIDRYGRTTMEDVFLDVARRRREAA